MENRDKLMAPEIKDIRIAFKVLKGFREHAISPHHERFIFPFLCGSYFTYRRIDVLRIVEIAKSISNDPTYLDVGCGYGDFLEKIREYLPKAEGIEKSAEIFYCLGRTKPSYISIGDAYHDINKNYDVIFVGWMEPGVDYRDKLSSKAKVIVTTLDQGLSLAAEFEGHGFEKVASWITPSWEDVNIEITNKYYTTISKKELQTLSDLRGAHNLWYVYCKKEHIKTISDALVKCVSMEGKEIIIPYEFEKILDETGYKYCGQINPICKRKLWEIMF
jgi:hypothetical protein